MVPVKFLCKALCYHLCKGLIKVGLAADGLPLEDLCHGLDEESTDTRDAHVSH